MRVLNGFSCVCRTPAGVFGRDIEDIDKEKGPLNQ
jgi:hypothetical protein